jgi:hypothetical protein
MPSLLTFLGVSLLAFFAARALGRFLLSPGKGQIEVKGATT